MKLTTSIILSMAILSGSLTQSACGSVDYITQLRLSLAVSSAFLDSLNLGDQRSVVAADFLELSGDAADLGDEIKACASEKPCDLVAVNKFQTHFFDVLRHGHFKLSPKLERIQTIMAAIVDAAKRFYGGAAKTSPKMAARARSNPSAELKDRLLELKLATSKE